MKRVHIVAFVVCCCLLVAFVVVRDSVAQKEFRALCGGVVQEEAVTEVLEGREVDTFKVGSGGSIGSYGRLAECKAANKDRTRFATFSVGTVDSAAGIIRQTLHDDLAGKATSAPLGANWPGMLTVQSSRIGHATVVLSCDSGRPDYLLLNVKYLLSGTDTRLSESKSDRLRLARAAAAMSKEADKRWKCGATLGKPISLAPVDMLMSEPKPLSEAVGTCRSLRRLAPAARKWGITRAIGTDSAAEAPAQDCLLVNAKGEKVYRLSALIGPLAQGYRESGSSLGAVPGEAGRDKESPGWAWASAKCPEGEPRALFTAASVGLPSDGEQVVVSAGFERELLNAFGSDVGAQHGCGEPDLP